LDSWEGKGEEFFLFVTVSRPALGPMLPPLQWIPGVMELGHEADHSTLRIHGAILHSPIHIHGRILC